MPTIFQESCEFEVAWPEAEIHNLVIGQMVLWEDVQCRLIEVLPAAAIRLQIINSVSYTAPPLSLYVFGPWEQVGSEWVRRTPEGVEIRVWQEDDCWQHSGTGVLGERSPSSTLNNTTPPTTLDSARAQVEEAAKIAGYVLAESITLGQWQTVNKGDPNSLIRRTDQGKGPVILQVYPYASGFKWGLRNPTKRVGAEFDLAGFELTRDQAKDTANTTGRLKGFIVPLEESLARQSIWERLLDDDA